MDKKWGMYIRLTRSLCNARAFGTLCSTAAARRCCCCCCYDVVAALTSLHSLSGLRCFNIDSSCITNWLTYCGKNSDLHQTKSIRVFWGHVMHMPDLIASRKAVFEFWVGDLNALEAAWWQLILAGIETNFENPERQKIARFLPDVRWVFCLTFLVLLGLKKWMFRQLTSNAKTGYGFYRHRLLFII